MRDAAQAAAAAVAEWKLKHVSPLQTRIAAEEKRLFTPPAPPSDPEERRALETRRADIRRAVANLDPLARKALYLSTDDVEVQIALETAAPVLTRSTPDALPSFQPMIDPAHVQRRQAARAAHGNPERARSVEELRHLATVAESAAATATAAMGQNAPGVALGA